MYTYVYTYTYIYIYIYTYIHICCLVDVARLLLARHREPVSLPSLYIYRYAIMIPIICLLSSLSLPLYYHTIRLYTIAIIT